MKRDMVVRKNEHDYHFVTVTMDAEAIDQLLKDGQVNMLIKDNVEVRIVFDNSVRK